jgi:hypothetical protein
MDEGATRPTLSATIGPVPLLSASESQAAIRATRVWLEKAVIGLNLCPFAKAVHVHRQIRYAVSDARTEVVLVEDLHAELQTLIATPPEQVDTTLLIHPHVLNDFADYNRFLDLAEGAVAEARLVGVIQLASFHPHYVFAGTAPDDITNYTNRSPYPMLHLLREASLTRAVGACPDAAQIYETNIATMKRLGHEGWAQLGLNPPEG